MMHIRQLTDGIYTAVTNDGSHILTPELYGDDLANHPAVLANPTLFQIVDEEVPAEYQLLNYAQE